MSSSLFIPEAGIELLLELMQAPEGNTQRELADSLRLRGSKISVAITKLVEEGVVSRRPDEVDGRAWRVTLEKRAPTGELVEQFEGYESFLTKKYTKQELQLVGRVLDDCIQLLKGTTWFPPGDSATGPRRLRLSGAVGCVSRPTCLPPLGDAESLDTALAAGADAVSFGLDEGLKARARRIG